MVLIKNRVVLLISFIFCLSITYQVYLLKWYSGSSTNQTKSILSSIRNISSSQKRVLSRDISNNSILKWSQNHITSSYKNQSGLKIEAVPSFKNVSTIKRYQEFYPIIQYLWKPRAKSIVFTYMRGSGFANRLRSMRGLLLLAMLNNASFCVNYDDYYSIMDNQLSILRCKNKISGQKWDNYYVLKRFLNNTCDYKISHNIDAVTCYDISQYILNCTNIMSDLKRYNRLIPTDNIPNYLSRFLFRPKSYLANYGNSVISKLKGTKVGIQLRFGGNLAYSKEKHSFLNPNKIDILLNRTKSILKEIKVPYTVFLSSDSPLGKTLLSSLHVPYISAEKYEIGHTSRNNYSHLQRAITDLYILSKCDIIIHTRYSSYGNMARVLSNPHRYYLLYN